MKRHLKRASLALLSGFLAFGAVQSARADDLLTTIKKTHEITVGTENDPPLSYVDSKGQLAGIYADITTEAFKRMGLGDVTVKPIAMPFASLIPSLLSGRIQMVDDSMTATAKRAEIISFTDTIYFNPESLDVAIGNPKHLQTLADLCGKAAGTYEGTTYLALLQKANTSCPADKKMDIHAYPTLDNAFADLSAGRVDAVVASGALSSYALVKNPNLKFELVKTYVPADRPHANSALAVSKSDTAFIAAFNKVYAGMLADGSVAKIFTKWGLTPTDFFLKP
nr:transporter substrate-binding domain-containing protein [uncultured Acidocella sp.]